MTSAFRPHLTKLWGLAFLFISVSLHAASPKEALLIANGKYAHFAGLAHPEPDAAKLSAALEQLGFRVRVVRDGNREEMLEAISEFERGLRNTGAIAFFHYGGHGVQVDGKNYLLPADSDIPDERRVATRAVALDEVMTAMDAAAARASIIVIDACRDNPLPAGSGRNLARGLSVVGLKPKNSIVIYAAEAGSKALDGLFTPILATALQQKGKTIDQVMKSVRSEVYAKSNGQQTPGEYNQLFEELFLGEPAGANESPEAIFAAKPAPTANAAIKPAPESKDNMVLVEGGTLPPASEMEGNMVDSFYIGRTEVTWLEWKKARNWATEHGYDIGDAGLANGNGYPVQDVNWYDCVKWCNALSEMRGLTPVYQAKGEVYRKGEFGPEGSSAITQAANANGYRLPTEAEWEWAARGGVNSRSYKYCGSDDLNSVGWYIDNSAGRLNPVAKKNTNEIGLYDMSGNLYEWCWDLGKLMKRRVRGGSAAGYSEACAVAYRHPDGGTPPDGRSAVIGFRLARSISKKDDMVFVEGGTLPDASELAGKTVKSFFIGRTEVTWLEWKKVRNWAADNGYDIGNVGEGSGNDHPVRDVSWYDCVKWCNARSEMDGLEPYYLADAELAPPPPPGFYSEYKTGTGNIIRSEISNGYRLPTEAEWEWAALGGDRKNEYLKFSGSNNLDEVAWHGGLLPYDKINSATTYPVGRKKPNILGIYDMSGNVWEWIWENSRVKGGSFLMNEKGCEIFHQSAGREDARSPSGGFRLARNPD